MNNNPICLALFSIIPVRSLQRPTKSPITRQERLQDA